jgi:hypothetical protein
MIMTMSLMIDGLLYQGGMVRGGVFPVHHAAHPRCSQSTHSPRLVPQCGLGLSVNTLKVRRDNG